MYTGNTGCLRKIPFPSTISLPKGSIPQIPEGYYSSGSNPNLRHFVEEQATPYDPATDTYKVNCFDKLNITTTQIR
jgi:hypothetical protein